MDINGTSDNSRNSKLQLIESRSEDRPLRGADVEEAGGVDSDESEASSRRFEAPRDSRRRGKERSAEDVLGDIGSSFKKLRKKSKAQAHRALIDDIAANLGVLCVPNESTGHIVLNLKDAMAMIREHEEFVKGSEQAEKSPLEAVREYFQLQ